MATNKNVSKEEIVVEKDMVSPKDVPMLPPDLSVDYTSESLNNMARTINEILTYLRNL